MKNLMNLAKFFLMYSMILASSAKAGIIEKLEGQVVNERDEPLAGVQILLDQERDKKRTTDGAGRFTLTHLNTGHPSSSSPVLSLTAKSYAPVFLYHKDFENLKGPLIVRLGRGHSILGKLDDERGNAVAGATIRASAHSWSHPYLTSDADGTFLLERLPSFIELEISSRTHTGLHYREIKPGEARDWVFTLPEAVPLRGRVIDQASGDPISSFRIETKQTSSSQGEPRYGQPTRREYRKDFQDKDGAFTLEYQSTKIPLQLRVAVEGRPEVIVENILPGSGEAADGLVIRVPRQGISVGGRVVDAAGLPLTGMEAALVVYRDRKRGDRPYTFNDLEHYEPRYAAEEVVHRVETDARGHFQFDGLPPAREIDLLVRGKGFAKTYLRELESEAAKDSLEIQMRPGAVISGAINRKTFPNVHAVDLRIVTPQAHDYEARISDPEITSFRFEGLAAGTYYFQLHKYGIGDRSKFDEVNPGKIELKEGEHRHFDLGFENRYDISGKVDIAGVPHRNGRVFLELHLPERPVGRWYWTTADENGSFLFEQMLPGQYTLRPGPNTGEELKLPPIRHPYRRSFKVGEADYHQTFQFSDLGEIAGKLGPGFQGKGVSVFVRGTEIPSKKVKVHENGEFRVAGLPPGLYSLELSRRNENLTFSMSLKRGIEISPQKLRHDLGLIDMSGRGNLNLHVKNPKTPLSISAIREDGTLLFTLGRVVEGDTSVLIEGIPSGSARIIAGGIAGYSKPEEIIIKPGETAELAVEIQLEASLSLSNPGEPGFEFAAATLTQQESGKEISVPMISMEEYLQKVQWSPTPVYLLSPQFLYVRGVAPGAWLLEVRYANGESWSKNIELELGAFLHMTENQETVLR